MTRVGVDTNVVVSFVTDRDVDQQARAAELFGAATSGEHVMALPQTVILEAVYVLANVYDTGPNIVRAVMRDLLSLPGVMAVDDVDWPTVWSLWPRRVRDFGDASLTSLATDGTFDVLATFDTAFAKRARRLGVRTYW